MSRHSSFDLIGRFKWIFFLVMIRAIKLELQDMFILEDIVVNVLRMFNLSI